MKGPSVLTAVTHLVFFTSGSAIALIFSPLLCTNNTQLNWPDIISSSVATLAFLLALITYKNWKKQKVQEDAYTTTKSYISTLISIEETVISMYRKFNDLIPRPGSIVHSPEYIKNEIILLKQGHNDLLILATQLTHLHDELAFWGASLTNSTDHTKTLNALDAYMRHSDSLINCLINVNIHQISDNTLIQHGPLTHDSMLKLFEIFKTRKSKKMSNYFSY